MMDPRALQEKAVKLGSTVLHQCMDPPCVARESSGVRSCTNVSGLESELVLRTIMEIRARSTSLTAMPRRADGLTSSRARWKDHFSISSVSLADLGGKNDRVYIAFLLVLSGFLV